MGLERSLRQNPAGDVVIEWDDGDGVWRDWASWDHTSEEGTSYRYRYGKSDRIFVVPSGMGHRNLSVGLAWWLDPLGVFQKRFRMYRGRKDCVSALSWNEGEQHWALSIEQVSALQFDALGVQLSHSLTNQKGFDLKWVAVIVGVLGICVIGYLGFTQLTKNEKPVVVPTDNVPVTVPVVDNPVGHWELNVADGLYYWVKD